MFHQLFCQLGVPLPSLHPHNTFVASSFISCALLGRSDCMLSSACVFLRLGLVNVFLFVRFHVCATSVCKWGLANSFCCCFMLCHCCLCHVVSYCCVMLFSLLSCHVVVAVVFMMLHQFFPCVLYVSRPVRTCLCVNVPVGLFSPREVPIGSC